MGIETGKERIYIARTYLYVPATKKQLLGLKLKKEKSAQEERRWEQWLITHPKRRREKVEKWPKFGLEKNALMRSVASSVAQNDGCNSSVTKQARSYLFRYKF